MPPALADIRAPVSRMLVWLVAAVPTVVTAVIAGLVQFTDVSPRPAIAVAAGGVATVCTLLLVHLALTLPHGPCRGAGFLGMGVLAGGIGVVAAGWLPTGWAAQAMTAGFLAETAMYLLGLLLLPGAAPTSSARLRRALDGLSIGTSLFFTARLLFVVPANPATHISVTLVLLVASAALAITVLTGVRAVRFRRAALACSLGVALAIVGDAVFVVLLLSGERAGPMLAAAAVRISGPLLVLAGARSATGAKPVQTTPPVAFAGHPLLVIPVGSAIVAAGYHLLTNGLFDRTTLMIGMVVVIGVTAREVFAALDVRRYAERLAEQEARFRSIVAGSNDVTIVLDDELVVRWQSPSAARQLGLSDQDVVGRLFSAQIHPDDAAEVAERLGEVIAGTCSRQVLIDARIRDGFGQWRDTESTVSDQRDRPEVAGLVVHIRDVAERKELERVLHRMAFSDPLTGLPNRRQLLRTLEDTRGRASGCAVLAVDLDGFKHVNDARGHEVGDCVLIEVARRLRASVRADDLPARLGGDEFAVVTTASEVEVRATAGRVLTVLAEPYRLPGTTVYLTASVGLADAMSASGVDEVLGRADLALRQAKQHGRNRIARYDESMEFQLLRRTVVEQELQGAIGRGELDLAYQPIVELANGRAVGVEALLRWRHPTLGTVAPAEFIPVADSSGLIAELGDWTLHRACHRLAGWIDDGRGVWMSVNVSSRQLRGPGFVGEVAAVLKTHQVPPERLLLEVTEQGVGEDVQGIVRQLAGLRALGVRTALDDFGAGHSALAHLRRLPVDLLKIDRVLLGESAGRSGPPVPLADLVVSLGQRLGMEVVAEGVEEAAHSEALQAAGCRLGQGYLFSRPLPAEHVEAFLDEHPVRP